MTPDAIARAVHVQLRARISPQKMLTWGWTRTGGDGTSASWHHRDGWHLEHCGHPTAHHPWMLTAPTGEPILTGIVSEDGPNRRHGTAWSNLAGPALWVELAGASYLQAATLPPPLPSWAPQARACLDWIGRACPGTMAPGFWRHSGRLDWKCDTCGGCWTFDEVAAGPLPPETVPAGAAYEQAELACAA